MKTVDLNVEQHWDELIQFVEAGEVLRLKRGDKDIAVVQPTEVLADDQAYLDFLAGLGVKQLGEAFPPNEFGDWEKESPNGAG